MGDREQIFLNKTLKIQILKYFYLPTYKKIFVKRESNQEAL